MSVAGIAARDASLARSAAAAQQMATDTATTALTSQGLHCINVQIRVDTSGFSAPPGTSASITVAVSCTVDLSDIGVAGLPDDVEALRLEHAHHALAQQDVVVGDHHAQRSSFGLRQAG